MNITPKKPKADVSLVVINRMETRSEFWKYVSIVVRDRRWTWLNWIFMMKIFGAGKCQWMAIRYDGQIVGGIVLADFPVAKYKPFNWFNPEARRTIDDLRSRGYLGGCCLVIHPDFQNRGIASHLGRTFFKEHPLKLYFTATKRAVPLYVRHGARVIYPGHYTIYTYQSETVA